MDDVPYLNKDLMPTILMGTETQSICYLCGNAGQILHHNLVDSLFGAPGAWSFRQCPNPDCGLIWLDPRPTVSEIGKAYRNYYTHGQPSDARQTRPARMLRTILHAASIALLGLRAERRRYKRMYLDQMPTGRLLEVGCGNGKRLARMQAMGWDVTGQEVDPVAADYVRAARGIAVHVGPLEMMDVAEKYDAVIMSHVIEHVHDPVALLLTCHSMLKENGLLVVLTPNAESYGHRKFGVAWRGLEPPRHLHLLSCRTLVQMAQRAGFSRNQCWTTPVGADGIGQGSVLPEETIRGRQGKQQLVTTRDVLRGFWFQLAASRIFRTDKNSGEECVLLATKGSTGYE